MRTRDSCGSGTFLVEAVKRLIQKFLGKSKYKGDVFRGFNVFHTDSLMPPGAKLEEFSDARVKPFLNNIKDIARIK
ncbi:MAG: hypothetical protein ACXQS5_00715, partial [Candidatus Methanospirareceae archaeon]